MDYMEYKRSEFALCVLIKYKDFAPDYKFYLKPKKYQSTSQMSYSSHVGAYERISKINK